ncbi:MAG TPA: AAA family ATPase [Candidatus Angelobacter sp.]|jgi:hypothetical protein
MYITHFEINNYKSYRATVAVDFKPGFNIITGKNNAGKTSLLEALALNFNGFPHRSLETVPAPNVDPPQTSSALINFRLSRDEILNLVHALGNTVYLPYPEDQFRLPDGSAVPSHTAALPFINWFLSDPEFNVCVRRSVTVTSNSEQWQALEPSLGRYKLRPESQPGRRDFIQVQFHPDGSLASIGTINAGEENGISVWLAQVIRSWIYRFFAERFNIGQSAFGQNFRLAANAQNLPEVLNVLQGNPQRFLQLNQLLHEILPQVHQISVLPSGNVLEIKAWPHDPNSQREDLALPLSQCGSGIGQVAAILYVVLTANFPQVIIIDEPQSLLHPGAIRKLIEVLKRYPQHQYILATHSPTVITSASPATVTCARLDGMETTFQTIDTRQTQDLQLYLADIGARLSDVFGADNVLWVEGQTEELAFPLILSQIARRSLMGTSIIGIRQTGDLEGRDAKRVFELYRRLTGAAALLPPALAFILDRECRSAALLEDLRRESQNRANFLTRRMYENYLLNPTGIASVVNKIENFCPEHITEEKVSRLIELKSRDIRCFCSGARDIPANWLTDIDGAKVLREIFAELSENRVSYDKVRHSIAITKWIISNAPRELQEIADLLVRILQK